MSLLLQDVRHSYALTEVLGGVGLALSPGRVLALAGWTTLLATPR